MGVRLGARPADVTIDAREGGGEASAVAGDEGVPELRLAPEVVMQARLGDLELIGDVGVADAVDSL
jgi:hypothetical protein